MQGETTTSHSSIPAPSLLDQSTKSGSKGESTNSEEPVYDPRLERAWRKVDFRVVPIVAIFYLLAFLDRTNLANARVAGLQKELKITDHQYSIALTVTYVPYILAQLPSNLILKSVGPNITLPTMLTLWGIVTTLQGVVKNFAGLLVCRFFLGLFEGGVFPGLILYLSFWYPRRALQQRVSAFFSTASLSGAFSGILAYGIIRMDGIGHRSGWSWIFILEGLFTFLFGLSTYLLLPRSPQHARFLSEEEKVYILSQLRATDSKDEESFSWRQVVMTYTLPQVVMIGIALFFSGAMLYGLAYFTPTIIHDLGYTNANAQLYSVPPFGVAFVVGMIAAFISDGFGARGLVSIFSSLLCTIGFSMYLGWYPSHVSLNHSTLNSHHDPGCASPHAKYGSLFFSITGAYIALPTLSTWIANNTAPHTRRATSVAFGSSMSNFGGILVTWLFGTLSPPPLYTKATVTLLTFSLLIVILTLATLWYLIVENREKEVIRKKVDRESEDIGLGDRSAWFVYNL
ncbi:hypothetical protein H0H93_003371 [Arthromyces matolae]|nr:hypothetical protein H0H93_003371 [Arthromyces matolae]